ncbi:MAG TPA: phosphopantetheine-binding protein [Candidatus Paceibacterota bacterium]|nr:phosphopantetheine-binding protein [Candidatus Paceibacterota bacterium]
MQPRERVIAIMSDTLGVPAETIRDDGKLADMAADSIALFELLIRLESAFDRHVRYDDIAHIETVGDVIAYVERSGTSPTDAGAHA